MKNLCPSQSESCAALWCEARRKRKPPLLNYIDAFFFAHNVHGQKRASNSSSLRSDMPFLVEHLARSVAFGREEERAAVM
jgi:hypothetical protein